jgi:hypothetical protein
LILSNLETSWVGTDREFEDRTGGHGQSLGDDDPTSAACTAKMRGNRPKAHERIGCAEVKKLVQGPQLLHREIWLSARPWRACQGPDHANLLISSRSVARPAGAQPEAEAIHAVSGLWIASPARDGKIKATMSRQPVIAIVCLHIDFDDTAAAPYEVAWCRSK